MWHVASGSGRTRAAAAVERPPGTGRHGEAATTIEGEERKKGKKKGKKKQGKKKEKRKMKMRRKKQQQGRGKNRRLLKTNCIKVWQVRIILLFFLRRQIEDEA